MSLGNEITLTKLDILPLPGQFVLAVTISGSGTVTLDPSGGIYSAGA